MYVLHSRESRFHFNQLLSAQYCHGFQLYLLFSFDELVVEHRNVFRISYFDLPFVTSNETWMITHTRATVNRFVFGFANENWMDSECVSSCCCCRRAVAALFFRCLWRSKLSLGTLWVVRLPTIGSLLEAIQHFFVFRRDEKCSLEELLDVLPDLCEHLCRKVHWQCIPIEFTLWMMMFFLQCRSIHVCLIIRQQDWCCSWSAAPPRSHPLPRNECSRDSQWILGNFVVSMQIVRIFPLIFFSSLQRTMLRLMLTHCWSMNSRKGMFLLCGFLMEPRR